MSIEEKDRIYDSREEGSLGMVEDDVLFGAVLGYLTLANNIDDVIVDRKTEIFKGAVSKVIEDKKNGKVTVLFSDGKKTESVCKGDDSYDFMIGFANCVLMWLTGNYTGFCSKLKKNKTKFISVDELRAKKEAEEKASGTKKTGKKSSGSAKHSK